MSMLSAQKLKMRKAFREALKRRGFRILIPLTVLIVWHLAVTTAVYEVGKHKLAPDQIYANGLGKFAHDGLTYEPQCVELCSIMKNEGPVAWWVWPTQLHVRLYSLSLMLFIRWFSFNILTIEILNLSYYLGIVALVFKIGTAIFDRASGLLAAGIVATWPSFLLHTTQLLRDPILILAILVFVSGVITLLRGEMTWRRGIMLALRISVAILVIRIVRLPIWSLLCAGVGAALVFLLITFMRRKRIDKTATVAALAMLLVTLLVPQFQPFFHNQQELRRRRMISPEEIQSCRWNSKSPRGEPDLNCAWTNRVTWGRPTTVRE